VSECLIRGNVLVVRPAFGQKASLVDDADRRELACSVATICVRFLLTVPKTAFGADAENNALSLCRRLNTPSDFVDVAQVKLAISKRLSEVYRGSA
jgi:hypothetical protein